MKSSLLVLLVALVAAVGAGLLSWNLQDERSQADFWAGLFLNLVPEALGIAASIIAALYVASRVAVSRFTTLAPKIFELLAQLRMDKTIGAAATQKAMTVLVPLLDESIVPPEVADGYKSGPPQNCRVCGQESRFHQDRGLQKCVTCGLRSEYWRAERTSKLKRSDA